MKLVEGMEAAARVARGSEPVINDEGEQFWTALVGRGPDGALKLLVPLQPDDIDDPTWLLASWSDKEAADVLRTLDARHHGAVGSA